MAIVDVHFERGQTVSNCYDASEPTPVSMLSQS